MLLRFSAKVVSVVFHPLIIVTYSLVLLLVVNPYLFGVNHISEGGKILISVFGTTFLLPAVGVGMMKALGLISSLHMPDKQERIGPFILTGIFYLWIFRMLFSGA